MWVWAENSYEKTKLNMLNRKCSTNVDLYTPRKRHIIWIVHVYISTFFIVLTQSHNRDKKKKKNGAQAWIYWKIWIIISYFVAILRLHWVSMVLLCNVFSLFGNIQKHYWVFVTYGSLTSPLKTLICVLINTGRKETWSKSNLGNTKK